ncbi:MAG: bifunctional 2-C-methyl-D-erythritol 4-phosphate cytidylyltransferase/2-C-methyl-D-erythritol 2,4-cyclodiphosphate synthase [Alphaproteobacteria bacterium]
MTRPESEHAPASIPVESLRDVCVVVVAAGSGSRMGGSVPKQYCLLGGRSVLDRAVECFLNHSRVGFIQPVIGPDAASLYASASAGFINNDRVMVPVSGGDTRQASVLAGLEALAGCGARYVLISDAARPFVTQGQIDRLLAALDAGEQAVIPAIAVVDTLKKADADGIVETTVSRDSLFRVQTPQAFLFDVILSTHRDHTGDDLTDDAAVAEAAGIRVKLVEGNPANVKLTLPEDMRMAESALQTPRTGTGFDVHRLEPGDGVMLCGVFIDHDRQLAGHSDADVGLHALTDAILGAIGDGDIGDHFPPGNPAWKGASSDRFLAHAGMLVTDKGGRITHVDVTLICERPKIGPFKERMKQRVADILGIGTDRVSVKATTTEKLGFTGRNEGIAAQAVATVLL